MCIRHTARRAARCDCAIRASAGAATNATQLTPFVAESTEKTRQTQDGYENYPNKFTGEDYLKAWKLAGGHDVVDTGVTGSVDPYRNMPAPFEERPAAKS
jgi:large subunit ribosomal protein L41